MRRGVFSVMVMAVVLLWVVTAGALQPGLKCWSQKLRIGGKYGACRFKAESRAVKKSGVPDFRKCDLKFSQKWMRAESSSATQCPTNGDQNVIQAEIASCTSLIAALLSGVTTTTTSTMVTTTTSTTTTTTSTVQSSLCGNGVVEANEDCDFGDLNGEDCRTQGFVGGVLQCGAGCAFDTTSCAATRFVDNGDGTVTDSQTGLMWEKKVSGSGCLHCVDDLYDWGRAMGDWISEVNGFSYDGTAPTGLGGHSDWRLPTISELKAIRDCSFGPPCIDPTFGITAVLHYWSSTSTFTQEDAWFVKFSEPYMSGSRKTDTYFVRAVRGGL